MVPRRETTLEILTRLRRLLMLYERVRRREVNLIQFLTKEIEQISEEGGIDRERNYLVETLISEYNYPRNFNEEEDDEVFGVEPLIKKTSNK